MKKSFQKFKPQNFLSYIVKIINMWFEDLINTYRYIISVNYSKTQQINNVKFIFFISLILFLFCNTQNTKAQTNNQPSPVISAPAATTNETVTTSNPPVVTSSQSLSPSLSPSPMKRLEEWQKGGVLAALEDPDVMVNLEAWKKIDEWLNDKGNPGVKEDAMKFLLFGLDENLVSNNIDNIHNLFTDNNADKRKEAIRVFRVFFLTNLTKEENVSVIIDILLTDENFGAKEEALKTFKVIVNKGKLSEQQLKKIISYLNDNSCNLKQAEIDSYFPQILMILGDYSDKYFNVIANLTESENILIKIISLKALKGIHKLNDRSVDIFVRSLKTDDPIILRCSLEALSKTTNLKNDYLGEIRLLLNSNDPVIKCKAFELLESNKSVNNDDIRKISFLLGSNNPHVVVMAFQVLNKNDHTNNGAFEKIAKLLYLKNANDAIMAFKILAKAKKVKKEHLAKIEDILKRQPLPNQLIIINSINEAGMINEGHINILISGVKSN